MESTVDLPLVRAAVRVTWPARAEARPASGPVDASAPVAGPTPIPTIFAYKGTPMPLVWLPDQPFGEVKAQISGLVPLWGGGFINDSDTPNNLRFDVPQVRLAARPSVRPVAPVAVKYPSLHGKLPLWSPQTSARLESDSDEPLEQEASTSVLGRHGRLEAPLAVIAAGLEDLVPLVDSDMGWPAVGEVEWHGIGDFEWHEIGEVEGAHDIVVR